MGIRNTIPLKDDISAGKGKFAVCQKKESSDSHVAIVHSDAIELMILDKRGNIQQQHVLDINELIVDEPDDIQVRKFETQTIKKSQLREKEGSVQSNTFLWQVLWCDNGDEPVLIIAHTNHLLRVMFDCSTKTWEADINRMLDQQGWISSLASINGYIYTGEIDKSGRRRRRTMKRVLQSTKSCSTTGSNEGLWEIGSQDMLSQSKLGKFPTTVICVSAEYLAAGDEQGGIVLFQGGPNSWSQIQRIQEKSSNCCTSMFILEARGENAFSTGLIRAYMLPTMECLSEIAGHIRWITEIFPVKGGFVSAAEDGFLHLWILGKNNDPSWDIRYMTSFELKDCMITGAAPFTDKGVLVTAYDRPQLFWVTLVGRVEEEPIDNDDTL
ncbi:hypothetical protein DAPPUDRAFT_95702 [Daphnia pulex]|uniref:Uncharacterized protein n=1 Tax=Daphnia pulex TaxID=6669 RepID=E9FUH5_DAPPU|nr:hypothetical protein DAPPUDRAFT_95702 [Daphnia pulex]|eukprot:EFX88922.1 hypothetical protein DAPPUDRAFT_95702 [Daphnia pulex]